MTVIMLTGQLKPQLNNQIILYVSCYGCRFTPVIPDVLNYKHQINLNLFLDDFFFFSDSSS